MKKKTLRNLREDSAKIDIEISKVCLKYDRDLIEFYRKTSDMPFELLNEALPYIEKQHSILTEIFKMKYSESTKVVHLSDFR